ncbi:retention module-containing protein, partial [Pseudomonas sp. MAP12]
MSNITAVVKGLVGQVFAISADGFRRQIFEGDHLLQGEQVFTGLEGEVVLQLADGEMIRLGGNSRWQAGAVETTTSMERAGSAGDIEQSLAAGLDPTLELQASAAGGGAGGTGGAGAGGEGHSFVVLSETSLRLDPIIGFSTDGMEAGAEPVIERLGVNTATVTVNMAAVNDAPIAVDDAVTATEDTPFSSAIDLDANDSDLDGDSLSVVAGTFTTVKGGTLVLAADGSYTYTPAANFHGTDSVDYTVTDGSLSDVGTLTLTVSPVNDAPVAVNDTLAATEDTAVTYTAAQLLGNDSDVDGDS